MYLLASTIYTLIFGDIKDHQDKHLFKNHEKLYYDTDKKLS